MRRYDDNGRRVVSGYLDMGGITIPPMPQYTVMTDRNDETTLWLLSFTTNQPSPDNNGFITLNSTIPDSLDKVVYGPWDGPILDGNPAVQLLVRNGHLGYEFDILPVGLTSKNQARIIARRPLSQLLREIIIPSDWIVFPDELGWSPL